MTKLLRKLLVLMGGTGVQYFEDVDGRRYMVVVTWAHDDD